MPWAREQEEVVCRRSWLTCFCAFAGSKNGYCHTSPFKLFKLCVILWTTTDFPAVQEYCGVQSPCSLTSALLWMLQALKFVQISWCSDYFAAPLADTLHRFSKKEHDWGWKKFMELSKVIEGFTIANTLVIKAQVQVIRYAAPVESVVFCCMLLHQGPAPGHPTCL